MCLLSTTIPPLTSTSKQSSMSNTVVATTQGPSSIKPIVTSKTVMSTTQQPTTTPTTRQPTTTLQPTTTPTTKITTMKLTQPATTRKPTTPVPTQDEIQKIFCENKDIVICTGDTQKVCGSDGITYANK